MKIVESEDVYVGNFNFHGNHIITQPRGENETRWYFTVEARPMSHAKFIWEGPRGEIIDDHNLEKYEKNIERDQVKLVIKDVTIDDMGPYPFKVSVAKGNKSESSNETLVLIVRKEPNVTLSFNKEPALPFFKVDKDYTIECAVKGYPIDQESLELYFYPCDNYDLCYPNKKRQLNTSLQPIDGIKDPKYNYHFSTKTMFRAEETGKVGCDICNKGDPKCVKTERNMFISENENGFEISGVDRKREIVEGDSIQLRCEASRYKYSKIVWLKGMKNGTEKTRSEISSKTEDSKYSFIQTLEFVRISKADEGKYICEATKIGSDLKDKQTRKLHIHDIEKPIVQMTNLNESTIHANAEEEVIFICDVFGRPKPDIQWFKDGHRVNETNFIEESGAMLQLKYVRGKDSGKYTCVAENRGGRLELWTKLYVADQAEIDVGAVIGGSAAAGIILLVVILVMLWKIREYNNKIRTLTAAELQLFEHGDPNSINEQLDVHEQTDLLPYDK